MPHYIEKMFVDAQLVPIDQALRDRNIPLLFMESVLTAQHQHVNFFTLVHSSAVGVYDLLISLEELRDIPGIHDMRLCPAKHRGLFYSEGS